MRVNPLRLASLAASPFCFRKKGERTPPNSPFNTRKSIDMPRAVAYIRYHIVFRACRAAWFVARLESAMQTSGKDRFKDSEYFAALSASRFVPVER